MKVDNLFIDSEKNYLYMERYVNNGSPSGFDKIHTSSDKTSPRDGDISFSLPIIRFDNDIEVTSIGTDPLEIDSRCMFCHPDNLNHPIMEDLKKHWEIVDMINVAPTASARTVKWLGHNYFIKLDYMGYLGRITRNLDYQHVLSAYEVTRDLVSGIETKSYNDRFGLLTENKGKIAYLPRKDGSIYELGYIVRDYKPISRDCSSPVFLIPAFSLFGNDLYASEDEPIIIQLYKHSGMEINDFAYSSLIEPLIRCYFDPLVHHGLALEAHAQNTLIAIDEKAQIRLVVSRDMESVDKDLPLREFLNVKSTISSVDYKCIRKTDYNYTIKHSFMFDFKLGEYLVSPLLDAFSCIPSFNKEMVVSEIKSLSASYISRLPNDYFPPSWYSYENIQFEPSKKRPYIAHESPKYR